MNAPPPPASSSSHRPPAPPLPPPHPLLRGRLLPLAPPLPSGDRISCIWLSQTRSVLRPLLTMRLWMCFRSKGSWFHCHAGVDSVEEQCPSSSSTSSSPLAPFSSSSCVSDSVHEIAAGVFGAEFQADPLRLLAFAARCLDIKRKVSQAYLVELYLNWCRSTSVCCLSLLYDCASFYWISDHCRIEISVSLHLDHWHGYSYGEGNVVEL